MCYKRTYPVGPDLSPFVDFYVYSFERPLKVMVFSSVFVKGAIRTCFLIPFVRMLCGPPNNQICSCVNMRAVNLSGLRSSCVQTMIKEQSYTRRRIPENMKIRAKLITNCSRVRLIDCYQQTIYTRRLLTTQDNQLDQWSL